MPWKGIGVAIAVVVGSLILLGRTSGLAVDWAWFSTIGYVDVHAFIDAGPLQAGYDLFRGRARRLVLPSSVIAASVDRPPQVAAGGVEFVDDHSASFQSGAIALGPRNSSEQQRQRFSSDPSPQLR
jgi:hypothetical protein